MLYKNLLSQLISFSLVDFHQLAAKTQMIASIAPATPAISTFEITPLDSGSSGGTAGRAKLI
jgi:hypothetical protein